MNDTLISDNRFRYASEFFQNSQKFSSDNPPKKLQDLLKLFEIEYITPNIKDRALHDTIASAKIFVCLNEELIQQKD